MKSRSKVKLNLKRLVVKHVHVIRTYTSDENMNIKWECYVLQVELDWEETHEIKEQGKTQLETPRSKTHKDSFLKS